MTRWGLRFAVGAVLVAGCDSHPNVDFRDDGTPEPTLAGAPLDVAAVAGTGLISLTWSAPVAGDAVTAYRVLVATTAFDLWDAGLPGAVETTAGCCAFLADGLNDDQTYWLGVTAINPAGEGPISQVVSARPPGWVDFQLLDTNGSLQVLSVSVSASSIFVSGKTTGTIDGSSAEGAYDAFISRYDRTGRRTWTRLHGTADMSDTTLDAGWGVAVDSGGNAVVVGAQDLGLSSTDYLVARYFEDGALDFNYLRGTASNDEARGVAIDASWMIYVAGSTLGSLDGQTNGGGVDAFLVRLDSAGTRLSTTLIKTAQADVGHAVAVLPDGTAYVAGETAGTLPSGSLPANSGLGIDGFVSKLNSAGTVLWTKQVTSSGSDRARAVALDAAGNVYVAGEAGGNLGDGFLSGTSDAFIGKFTSNGTQVWLHLLGNTGEDKALGVSVSEDTVYLVGQTPGGIGGTDGFLAAYSLAGTLLWVNPISQDYADDATCVDVGPDGQIYVGGKFDTNQISISDGFVGKFSPNGELQ